MRTLRYVVFPHDPPTKGEIILDWVLAYPATILSAFVMGFVIGVMLHRLI